MKKKPSVLTEFTPDVMYMIDSWLQEEGYELRDRIGSGGYSVIYKVFSKHYDQEFAVKILNTNSTRHANCLSSAQTEVSVLTILCHPNIIKCYKTFERDGFIFIILELCAGHSLQDLIKKNELEVADKFRIMRETLMAVSYMHSQGIAHCDIKPANVLFDNNGKVQLADFGLAKFFEPGELCHEYGGSPAYMAPEIYRKKPYHPFPADVWALAVTFYLLVGGKLEKSSDRMILAESITKGGLLIQGDLNPPIQSLLIAMTEMRPSARPTIEKILQLSMFKPPAVPKLPGITMKRCTTHIALTGKVVPTKFPSHAQKSAALILRPNVRSRTMAVL